MPNRIALSTLQGSTVDILNVIRTNAGLEYQNQVPEITSANEIPRVGEILFGYPTLANQFLASLMNRIALVRVKSATFNNKFSRFKKGYLGFGETVEEIFVELAKVQRFDPEKSAAREFKRTKPDVRTAFHAMNWRVQYPITISNEELRTAFTSESGVRDLIEKVTTQVYTAAEYDEWLLFKYLIIKAVTHGKMHPISIGDGNMTTAAETYRGVSGKLEFLSSDYNTAGVYNATPKSRQSILMDVMYKAKFDVEVLASAFNMDKVEFMGKLTTVDSFSTFDNTRWEQIRAECDGIEEVTVEELNLMKGVKAVLLDEDWFQFYDNLLEMTEQYVASGMYRNYWFNTFKTVSSSPFANAVVFALDENMPAVAETYTVEVMDKSVAENAIVLTLAVQDDNTSLTPTSAQFVQTEAATAAGIAVHKFGGVIFPNGAGTLTLEMTVNGNTYQSSTQVTGALVPGATITMEKV